MKKITKILFTLLVSFNLSFAFAGQIDHFIVEFNKDKAETGEALDLTIKAVDKNDEIVKDYEWTILWLSETDDTARLPLDLTSDDWYTFKLSDQWVKKFENSVVFNNEWEQSVSIYDTNDYENITWKWEITIVKWAGTNEKAEIEIVAPRNNTVVSKNIIQISWATKKNHQVQIEINETKKVDTISNSDWIFEKEIELDSWKNIIKAYVLDSDWKVIWESDRVIVEVDNNKPVFKKIILSPLSESGSVEEATNVNAKVFATEKLKTVKLLFNDQVIPLAETENWVYTWNFKTPELQESEKEKDYIIWLVLADELWHSLNLKKVAKIKVVAVVKNSAPSTSTWTIETCSGITDKSLLKITWLKLVKLKTKSILTWNKNKYAESYDIYQQNSKWEFEFLQNVKEEKFEVPITWDKIKYNYFAVKAKAKWCNKEKTKEIELNWDLSEATKIQTWPKELLFILIISLLLWAWFFFVKRKNS